VWEGNLHDLASHGLRVIAPDLPGFGMSDNPEDVSVGFRAKSIIALMDQLGIERAHIVGHSQSGQIAVRLALSQPDRIGKIVVLGTASMLPPVEDASDEGDEAETAPPTHEQIKEQLLATTFDASKVTSEAVALRQRMSAGKNFEAFLARRAAKGNEKKKDSKPLWQRLDEVKVPMRLIYGRQDRAAERRVALARERYPSIDLHLIDRCRHLVQWDAPARMASLVGEFLARGESASRAETE
jgi:pimeloyl-ACP methyl ester carboxylesterase